MEYKSDTVTTAPHTQIQLMISLNQWSLVYTKMQIKVIMLYFV